MTGWNVVQNSWKFLGLGHTENFVLFISDLVILEIFLDHICAATLNLDVHHGIARTCGY
jgi:hypothetical protein